MMEATQNFLGREPERRYKFIIYADGTTNIVSDFLTLQEIDALITKQKDEIDLYISEAEKRNVPDDTIDDIYENKRITVKIMFYPNKKSEEAVSLEPVFFAKDEPVLDNGYISSTFDAEVYNPEFAFAFIESLDLEGNVFLENINKQGAVDSLEEGKEKFNLGEPKMKQKTTTLKEDLMATYGDIRSKHDYMESFRRLFSNSKLMTPNNRYFIQRSKYVFTNAWRKGGYQNVKDSYQY